MSAEKTIKDQYASLCQRLGDSTYKRDILDQEIEELKNQIKGLNVVNSALQMEQLRSKKSFLEQRKEESGAQSVEAVSGLPSFS